MNIAFPLAADPYQSIAQIAPVKEISNLASGGSLGSAATTVDIYGVLAVNQTTASKAITLATPSNTALSRRVTVANVGTAGFYMYGRLLSPGGSEEFLYVPGVGWRRMQSSNQVIAQRGTQQLAPNDTATNVLDTVTIPGGMIGPNGAVRISHLWACTGSTNSKTIRIQFGGTSYFSTAIVTGTQVLFQGQALITNRGVANSQIGASSGNAGVGVATSGAVTSSVDTDSDVTITFQAIKDAAAVAAGDAISLERYIVELLRFD